MQSSSSKLLSPAAQKLVAGIIFALLFIALVVLACLYLPSELWGPTHSTSPALMDWRTALRPAALDLVHGRSPFGGVLHADGVYNPPWAFIPLIPFALLPEQVGGAILFVLNFFAYGFIAYRFDAKPLFLVAFILSPFVIENGFCGNIDWIVALGIIMPPQIGLFFLSMKPQIGIAVAVFWLVESWHKGGWKEVVRVFAPVTALFLLSLVVFGLWPLDLLIMPKDKLFNVSLFPWSISLGLGLLYWSLRIRKILLSVTASPFLSPYLTIHSYAPAQLGLGANSPAVILSTLFLWAMKFIGII